MIFFSWLTEDEEKDGKVIVFRSGACATSFPLMYNISETFYVCHDYSKAEKNKSKEKYVFLILSSYSCW